MAWKRVPLVVLLLLLLLLLVLLHLPVQLKPSTCAAYSMTQGAMTSK
jgi:hypothetical protein